MALLLLLFCVDALKTAPFMRDRTGGGIIMFKFKEIKEVKPDETKKVKTQKEEGLTKKVKTQKEEGFLKIKPEAGMTKLEALCFWDEMFSHRGV